MTHWKRKPDLQLIDESLLPMPAGYVREADKLRRMSAEERVIAGLEEPPQGYKLVDGQILPMSLLEQVKAGLITQTEYEQYIASENTTELLRRLAELQTPEATAQAEVDENFAAERKTKLAALLAVKKQKDWPLDVEWPEG